MKYFFAILAVVLFQFSGFAQSTYDSKEQIDVASRVEALRKAMIDADVKKLKELTSEALSYGHSSGKLENQSVFIEKIANGESDFVTIEFQNQTIEIVGNVAIVRHNLVAQTKDKGMIKILKLV